MVPVNTRRNRRNPRIAVGVFPTGLVVRKRLGVEMTAAMALEKNSRVLGGECQFRTCSVIAALFPVSSIVDWNKLRALQATESQVRSGPAKLWLVLTQWSTV